MPKIAVIADPDALPPELAGNPDVIVIPPDAVDPDTMSALDAASGGLLMEEGAPPEGGEGSLSDWAAEEEREPEHAGAGRGDDDDDEDMPPAGTGHGRGDDEGLPPGGRAGDDEEDMPPAGTGRGRHGRGRGDDDEEDRPPVPAAGAGRGRSGRSPLAAWVGRR